MMGERRAWSVREACCERGSVGARRASGECRERERRGAGEDDSKRREAAQMHETGHGRWKVRGDSGDIRRTCLLEACYYVEGEGGQASVSGHRRRTGTSGRGGRMMANATHLGRRGGARRKAGLREASSLRESMHVNEKAHRRTLAGLHWHCRSSRSPH